ncbi:MAG: biotin carboxylase N-terminal domain-containing protein, partial [Deltaproteobacteria bacterium]|nr:biotin carboxylase N-terminal domain-containing protein [Deltaproteobacteria bacterium]
MSGERASRGRAGNPTGEGDLARDIRRIAVLNRGDAATRCLRAIRELRVEEHSDLVGIALYTDVDQSNPYVREADEAVSLGQPLHRSPGHAPRLAYLNQDRLLSVLRESRADTVWPGWGFLAEDPGFADRLRTAGITFIGPPTETLRVLADKVHAKRLAEQAGVPVLPWSNGSVDRKTLRAEAARLGFPLVIKATHGGGGRGIRRVTGEAKLAAAFQSAASEAAAAFGDGTIFLEKSVEKARHVEVQFAADQHGVLLALGLRDCSVQRRHQKVVEEGPPPGLSESLCREMQEAALRLAREVGYVGLGTCEFLVTGAGEFYFLEVNPRLQVEHGVTEALTGFDLVKWQFRIARGARLPDVAPEDRGHAIEVRLCAEDPSADFVPTPGRIALLELPSGPGIRVDSGVSQYGAVPLEFDSMIAKIIAHGATRGEARARLIRALLDTRLVIEGGTTNKGFLLDVLGHPDFVAGRFYTDRLAEAAIGGAPEPRMDVLLAAAVLTYQKERGGMRANFFAEASRGRPRVIPASLGAKIALVYGGHTYRLEVFAIGGWNYLVYLDGRMTRLRFIELGPHGRRIVRGSSRSTVFFSETEVEFKIELDGRTHRVQRDIGGKVRAPAPALLIEIAVKPGDEVETGDRLGLLEAMKTETTFVAPVSGTIREIIAQPGVQVSAGQEILTIEPRSAAGAPVSRGPLLELEIEPDPLDAFMNPESLRPDLTRASELSKPALAAATAALLSETQRILMGYDVNPPRAQMIVEILDAPLQGITAPLQAELARLAGVIPLLASLEALFSRAPGRLEGGELGPSNDARMTLYLRRIAAEGAGLDAGFLDQLRRVLVYYGVTELEPTEALFRAVLRLCAARTTLELRSRIVMLILNLLIRLVRRGEPFTDDSALLDGLDRLVRLRGAVSNGVSDLAAYARHLIVDGTGAERPAGADGREADPSLTLVTPPDPMALARQAAEVGLDPETARRMEIWRLAGFQLKPLESLPGFHLFRGRARNQIDDERIFCFAEVNDLGPDAPNHPDTNLLARRFRDAIEALRSIQGLYDPNHRLHWNRLYIFLRPPLVVDDQLVDQMVSRLASETAHLGLEKIIVRFARVDPLNPGAPPQMMEVLGGNPTGSRVETSLRVPHSKPLEPATPYERKVAMARARGLTYPYEVIRLFMAYGPTDRTGPGRPLGPGEFIEYDLAGGRALPVQRPFGENESGVVFGTIRTPTAKYPEGMRRVLLLSDPTRSMGALTASECDRITAAIDLAEREGIPVEWVAVSAGAHIAMDSGTENLDATARVVRRLVTFTDAGGEVNLILAGVNVGAQSYFDALATMGVDTRGVLIMLTSSSMVLTGVAALEASGGVAAEDELGIGGYERTMGPN